MSKTKDRMRESNLRYRQSLGQNFIYDEELLAALTEAAEVSGDEDVLEIGPGCGSLTKHLCRAARKVLSIELDERLIPLLSRNHQAAVPRKMPPRTNPAASG